jgi:hypothetical protein
MVLFGCFWNSNLLMETEMSKNYEREEIQKAISPVVKAKLEELEVGGDTAHVRRTVRAILRMGAQVALRAKCDPQTFLALALEAFSKEGQATDQVDVVLSPAPTKNVAQA